MGVGGIGGKFGENTFPVGVGGGGGKPDAKVGVGGGGGNVGPTLLFPDFLQNFRMFLTETIELVRGLPTWMISSNSESAENLLLCLGGDGLLELDGVFGGAGIASWKLGLRKGSGERGYPGDTGLPSSLNAPSTSDTDDLGSEARLFLPR